MKSKMLAGLLLAGGSLFAGPRISVGVRFGAPAPVAPTYVDRDYVPPCPGPDYVFIDGYWQHRRPAVEHRDRDDDRHDDRHDGFRRDFDRH